MKRGLLIVFEGLDGCGKSTQANLLTKALKINNFDSTLLVFPERTTPVGRAINDHLKSNVHFNIETIHLLFTANRWELKDKITQLLESGVNVVLDRYFISGTTYTMAKQDYLSNWWIVAPEIGLPKPDIVFFMSTKRFLEERINNNEKEKFEFNDFQIKVKNKFSFFFEHYKGTVDKIEANEKKEVIGKYILNEVKRMIEKNKDEKMKYLKVEDFGELFSFK
eukprot:GAHX01001152.1.p1 GENE.GAHX01001152.1~~GAHX01001152.1.p1  ORF type:complete len:239 (+),score=53.98 GAHX01001152.1:53-718(+)